MKTLFITMFFTLCIFLSCQQKVVTDHSLAIAVLLDNTDSLIEVPQSNSISSLFEMQKDKEKEIIFRETVLSNLSINPSIQLRLESGTNTDLNNSSQDPLYREKLIFDFYKKIDDTLKWFSNSFTKTKSLQNSECFIGIAKELVKLVELNTQKKILLIYSDLHENSDVYNVYKGGIQNKETIKTAFENTHLIPENLKQCTVLFIFQPKNRSEDKIYNLMFSIYKELLESHGAQVLQLSNNP